MLDVHTNGKMSNIYLRNNFESFDQLMDCQVYGCMSNQRRFQHWHCQVCQQEISEAGEMDLHICVKNHSVDSINNNKQSKCADSSSFRNSLSPKKLIIDEDVNGDRQMDDNERTAKRDPYGSASDIDNGSTCLTEALNRKRASSVATTSSVNSEEEKVSGMCIV